MRRVFQGISALLIAASVSQPIMVALPARAAVPLKAQQQGETLFAPFVSAGFSSEIVINSPRDGSLVAGSFVLSAQPLGSGAISAVDFFAGDTLLATDITAANGYSADLDSSQLPNGQVTLRAVARGSRPASAQISVTNVSNPAQQTVATESGAAVGASQIGSVIMVPPGGLLPGAAMTVTERTEQEISSEFGIQWDELGVTFLGAQVVDTSAPMEKPPAVSSAGFAQRVQPGQAVVNYNLAPDADGDGVAEIVVVNTARVIGGNVVSDPLPKVSVGEATVAGVSQGLAYAAQTGLHGAPGTMIEFDVTGFNLYSPVGNVARFKSAVNEQEFEMPAFVTQDDVDPARQLFSTQIPLLPAGAATMTMVNLTTMDASEPIAITVDAGPALDRPAIEIIDEYLAAGIAYINATAQEFPDVTDQFNEMAANYAELRSEFQTLSADPSPDVQQYLNDLATLILGSGILGELATVTASATGAETGTETGPFSIHPVVEGANVTQGCLRPNNRYQLRMMNVALGGLTLLGCALALTGVGAVVCAAGFTAFFAAAEVAQTTIPDCPPPPPCPPGGGGNGPTGMGSAPPPGGNLCGGGGGGGGGGGNPSPLAYTAATASNVLEQEAGRIKVFVISDGDRTPFTGSTDRGGYFFLPLVPQDKPFVAYAVDTETGSVRSYSGIGPKTGESLRVWFDFGSGEDAALENRWTGAGDGVDWEDDANWSLGRMPGPIDKVIIDVAADAAIDISTNAVVNSLVNAEALTISSGSLRLVTASSMTGKLTIAGGDLVIDSSLTLIAPLEWTGSYIRGDGHLTLNGGALLSGAASKAIRGVTVDNHATFSLGGTGSILGGEGAVFNNLSGATFEFASDADYDGDYWGGEITIFNNSGTVIKSGGTDVSSVEANFQNANAPIVVNAGTLEMYDGGTLAGGVFTVASGAMLDFASGGYLVSETLSGAGAGAVRLTGASFMPNPSSTINFTGGGFGMTSGTLEMTGTLTFAGIVKLNGNASKYIRHGVTINNTGTWIWNDPGSILGGEGAVFNNSGTFEIASDADYDGDYWGGVRTIFNNSGTVIKSGGTDVSFVEANFQNVNAPIVVNAGTLEMHDGGTLAGGTFTVASGALLDFASGGYLVSETLSGTGAGAVRLTGASLMPNPSGTINFTGGGFGMTSGTLEMTGTLTFAGIVNLSDAASKYIRHGVTVNNTGTWIWNGTGSILGGEGAVFNNLSGATFEFASDADYDGDYWGGVATSFNNAGTIRKSGTGLSLLEANFHNVNAAIVVDAGTLEMYDGGTLAGGTFTVASGALLDFASGGYLVSETLSGTGAGAVRLTGASFMPNPIGTINFTGGGFGMTAGSLEGAGTLTFAGLVSLSDTSSKYIRGGVTVNNTGTWTWSGPGGILGGEGAVFNNSGTFDAHTEGEDINYDGNYWGGVATIFNNTGSVIKSGDAFAATLEVCYSGTAPVGVTVVAPGVCP